MLSLVLTSDFPSTGNQAVWDRLSCTNPRPRIAWIPPFTAIGRERFPAARAQFEAHGLADVDYCDIDEAFDEEQLARLHEYDLVYLTGGDPIAFRNSMLRTGLPARLHECLSAGRLIVGASGGSMQLTRNLSLFRLLSAPLDEVCGQHAKYEALGLVDYEVLPHLNRFEARFLETVRCYSERVAHDIIALADGAAVLHTDGGDYSCVGTAARFRRGVMSAMEN